MNIIGQGGKIMLFTLPSLAAAILAQIYLPGIAALPESLSLAKPFGYALFFLGAILWGTAVIQLTRGFYRGRLVTTGAYGIVRNPIYSSATFFILPGIALISLTWVYLAVSAFLYAGVMLFIGEEERQLADAFGEEYRAYTANVDRLVPLKKP